MAHIGEYSIATVFRPGQHLSEPGIELLPAGIHHPLTRQCIEVVAFDGVNQTARLPGGRDQVIPPPRRHVRAGRSGLPAVLRLGWTRESRTAAIRPGRLCVADPELPLYQAP